MRKIILDLCGGTGAWSRPYADSDYDVRVLTLPAVDVRTYRSEGQVHGVLAAPPCTCFSYARNRYPPTDTEFAAALEVVGACLRIIWASRPAWWALENPVNKLRWFLGEPQYEFRQWEFGDPGEKPTALWGSFNYPRKRPQPRTKASTFKTKKQNAEPWDAVTPPKFAEAFFKANP